MNMLNYKKNNNTENANSNILIRILWIIKKYIFIIQIIIFFRWILCIRKKNNNTYDTNYNKFYINT
jgi:hypothetical protein